MDQQKHRNWTLFVPFFVACFTITQTHWHNVNETFSMGTFYALLCVCMCFSCSCFSVPLFLFVDTIKHITRMKLHHTAIKSFSFVKSVHSRRCYSLSHLFFYLSSSIEYYSPFKIINANNQQTNWWSPF